MLYDPVPRNRIADSLMHLRELFRRSTPATEKARRTHERREIVIKNLLSNLYRIKEHPTLPTVLEMAEIFSLTLDGAHRLFGYDIEKIREYDLQFNSGRTHIIESYAFERDQLIDLPSQFAPSAFFEYNAMLGDVVEEWHKDKPIRILEEEGWHKPGTFYVHVGTEDSLGSSLPPGSTAVVEPVEGEELLRPDAGAIYLLQFPNGYRCNRCVVSRGRLVLLVSAKHYKGVQEFNYPGEVRIAGRLRAFASSLPLPEHPGMGSLPSLSQGAPLILPWEHSSLDQLFAAEHLRFRRSRQDNSRVRHILEEAFHSRLSGRTERRYRYPTPSQPHIDTLIQLTMLNAARYTDALRAHRALPSDVGRFSLQTLLNARHLNELHQASISVPTPSPHDLWEGRMQEFVEWPSLLSMKFPHLRSWGERVIRIAQHNPIPSLEPAPSSGSLMVISKLSHIPDPVIEAKKTGWGRPLYALRRGAEFLYGHLERHGGRFALLYNSEAIERPLVLGLDEVMHLSRVTGVAVPV
jgi:hypothetical protein